MSSNRDYKPGENGEADNSPERVRPMQRGVSQLLFNYLPYRTVDWEDGMAIVQLGDVRFSTIWERRGRPPFSRKSRSTWNGGYCEEGG